MKTYVINMRKDVIRRNDMKRQFNELNLTVEFFEGVDGSSIGAEQFAKIADIQKLEYKEKRPISELKGMVGCTYSHYLIYLKMLEENIDVACILEDDVILANDFESYLQFIESDIKQNEIVSLHTLLYDSIELNGENRKYAECEIFKPIPAKIRGTQGYVLTQQVAAQLIKEMMPIKEFPDCFNLYHQFCPDVQIRVLFPFIIRHMWIDSVRDTTKGIKVRVLNAVHKYRIFPLWNIIRMRRRWVNDNHISSFITVNSKRAIQLYVNSINKNRLLSRY